MTRICGTTGRAIALTGLVIFSFLLTSCGNEEGFTQIDAPTGFLRVVHAVSDAPVLQFIVDERPEANLRFSETSGFINTLPELPIEVRVVYFVDRQPVTVASTEITIKQNHDVTVIAAGTLDNPRLITTDNGLPEFDPEATTAEIQFVHGATKAPDALNFSTDQTDALTLSFGDTTELIDIPADTTTGFDVSDANDTSLWSASATMTASTRSLLLLIDYFGPGNGTVRLARISEGGTGNFASDHPSAIRIANMLPDRGPVDVMFGTTVLAQAISFGETGEFVNIPAGQHDVRVTLSGQPENAIYDDAYLISAGLFQTLTVTGLGENISSRLSPDDFRQVPIRLTLNVTHAAPSANPDSSTASLDFYLLEQGDTVDSRLPNAALSLLSTSTVFVLEGTYDMVITAQGTEDILFGPQRVDLVNDNLYRIFLTDTPGGGTPIQVVLEDDFQ